VICAIAGQWERPTCQPRSLMPILQSHEITKQWSRTVEIPNIEVYVPRDHVTAIRSYILQHLVVTVSTNMHNVTFNFPGRTVAVLPVETYWKVLLSTGVALHFCSDSAYCGRMRLKCDGARSETIFRLSAKQTSPFKSAGASVQSAAGRRVVRISGQRLHVGNSISKLQIQVTTYVFELSAENCRR